MSEYVFVLAVESDVRQERYHRRISLMHIPSAHARNR